jgi:hypothetical protein
MPASLPSIIRGVLTMFPSSCILRPAARVLLDPAGRIVALLRPGPNDISGIAPGVYFAVVLDDRGVPPQKIVIVRP